MYLVCQSQWSRKFRSNILIKILQYHVSKHPSYKCALQVSLRTIFLEQNSHQRTRHGVKFSISLTSILLFLDRSSRYTGHGQCIKLGRVYTAQSTDLAHTSGAWTNYPCSPWLSVPGAQPTGRGPDLTVYSQVVRCEAGASPVWGHWYVLSNERLRNIPQRKQLGRMRKSR